MEGWLQEEVAVEVEVVVVVVEVQTSVATLDVQVLSSQYSLAATSEVVVVVVVVEKVGGAGGGGPSETGECPGAGGVGGVCNGGGVKR